MPTFEDLVGRYPLVGPTIGKGARFPIAAGCARVSREHAGSTYRRGSMGQPTRIFNCSGGLATERDHLLHPPPHGSIFLQFYSTANVLRKGSQTNSRYTSAQDKRLVATGASNMQRYFFHIEAGDLGLIPDTEGELLYDFEAAHLRAVRIMFATMAAADEVEEDWRGWKLKMTDITGRSRLILLYRLPSHGRKGHRTPTGQQGRIAQDK